MKERLNKSKVNKKILISILLLLAVLASSTLAWFVWSSQNNTNMIITIGNLAEVTFVEGNNINITNLAPTFNYNEGVATDFQIKKRKEVGLLAEVSLDITKIDAELQVESFKWVLVSSTDGTNYNTTIATGSFKSVPVGKLVLKSSLSFPMNISYYKLYFYIDGNIENNTNMQGKTLTATLNVAV